MFLSQKSLENKSYILEKQNNDAANRFCTGSLQLLYFSTKVFQNFLLQGFGPQEGYPLIHNDLLFYVEVSKFVASYHEDYDLVTLKRKIMSIRDCFIDSHMEKSLQVYM